MMRFAKSSQPLLIWHIEFTHLVAVECIIFFKALALARCYHNETLIYLKKDILQKLSAVYFLREY